MSKKLIAILFCMALCVPALFAQGQEHKVMSVAFASASDTAATATSSPCEVSYIVVSSSGSQVNITVRILNGGTTVFALSTGTSAYTETIDLTNTPIAFGTSLIVDSSTLDNSVYVTVVYRKRN